MCCHQAAHLTRTINILYSNSASVLMRRILKFVGLLFLLFVVFVIAGCIGMLCEQFHNDLIVSTVSFLGSFGVIGHYAVHIYNSFM